MKYKIRDHVVGELLKRHQLVMAECSRDRINQKKLKSLIDDFNYVYKKASLIEQGEFHYKFAGGTE